MNDYREFSVTHKVKARQIGDEPEDIVTRDGKQTVMPGDWIVLQDGYPTVMDNDSFQDVYGDKAGKADEVRKAPAKPKQ